MTIDELIEELNEIKASAGNLPVFIDKNRYEVSQLLDVWQCEAHSGLPAHVHLKAGYVKDEN